MIREPLKHPPVSVCQDLPRLSRDCLAALSFQFLSLSVGLWPDDQFAAVFEGGTLTVEVEDETVGELVAAVLKLRRGNLSSLPMAVTR